MKLFDLVYLGKYKNLSEEIISRVEDSLRFHEIINNYYKKNALRIFTFSASFVHRVHLIKILCNILSKSFPDVLYDKYEKLSSEDQKIIRDKIARIYYLLTLETTNNLADIAISFETISHDAYGDDIVAFIPLPTDFVNQNYLKTHLSNCMGEIINQFIEENEVVQYKSAL